jgi:hypothetical protein
MEDDAAPPSPTHGSAAVLHHEGFYPDSSTVTMAISVRKEALAEAFNLRR